MSEQLPVSPDWSGTATTSDAAAREAMQLRGWHPDPSNPQRERWHDGVAFTEHTHRALRRASYLGAGYDRSMWPGANHDARIAQRASNVSSIIFLLAFIGVLAIVAFPVAFTVIGILMLLLAVSATAQVLFGARGWRRASVDGALGIAITVVLQGAIYLLISVGYLVTRVVFALIG